MSDVQEDFGRLKRALLMPVPELIAAEVESPARAREIILELALDLGRRSHVIELDYHRSTAAAVLDEARRACAELREDVGAQTPPFLSIIDVSENREGTAEQPSEDDNGSRAFWRDMNLLREEWDRLGAQTILLLQSYHWRRLLRFADHLAAWIFVKVHLVRASPELEAGMSRAEGPIGHHRLSPKEAQERLETVGRQLAEAKSRGPADKSWIRRFYLPLLEAALARADGPLARRLLDEALPWEKDLARNDVPQWIELNRQMKVAAGDLDTAQGFAERLARWAEENNDIERRAWGFEALGDIAFRRSEYHTASSQYEQALETYRQIGHLPGKANCIKRLGDIAFALSDYETARVWYGQARYAYQQMGSLQGVASSSLGLGEIALLHANHAAARVLYEQALPLYKNVGDRLGEANCLKRLGDIALEWANLDSARARYEEALLLYKKVGNVLGEANCILRMGEVAERSRDDNTACARYEEALPVYRRAGDGLGQASCFKRLGDIAYRQSNNDAAKEAWERALVLYDGIPNPRLIGETHRRLARISSSDRRQKHIEAARQAWKSIGRIDLISAMEAELERVE
jgi:tetratricopeptide (TPR) repeat protein